MEDKFLTNTKPTWCPGCGNFGIWMALKNALTNLGIPREKVVVVYGVGCHGNMRDWLHVYGIQGLHGRGIPLAQGVKLANTDLTVIVVSGDGDCLGEGGNHFLHAARRNPNITVLIHNNELYSLTTGQASPTAEPGFRTKSTPEGVVDPPVNPLALTILSGGTFAARGFSGDAPGLTEIMQRAIVHKGFSVVDILQPCVTFDRVHTYEWYRKRVKKVNIPAEKLHEKAYGLEQSQIRGETILLGVLYEADAATSEDREYSLKNTPLCTQGVNTAELAKIASQFQ